MIAFRCVACLAVLMTAIASFASSRANAQQAAIGACDESIAPGHEEPLSRTLAQGRVYSCGRRVPVSAVQQCENTASAEFGECVPDPHATQDEFELRYARDGRVFLLLQASTMWTEQPRVTAARHGAYWVFTITAFEEHYSRVRTRSLVIFSERGEVFRSALRECEDSGQGYECASTTRITWLGAHRVRAVTRRMPDPSGDIAAPELSTVDLRTATPTAPLTTTPTTTQAH